MNRLLRTCVLLMMVGSQSQLKAAPLLGPVQVDKDITPPSPTRVKASYAHSLNGLMAIPSWESNFQQPFQEFEALYQAASTAQHELATLTRQIAMSSQTKPLVPAVKSRDRALKKIEGELDGKVSLLTDLARSTLVADDIQSLVHAYSLLNDEVELLRVKNRFNQPAKSGYRDISLLVRLPHTGLTAEIQLHLSEIAAIKSGPEHHIYEQIQRLEHLAANDKRDLTELEQAHIKQLQAESRQLYKEAWHTHLSHEQAIAV